MEKPNEIWDKGTLLEAAREGALPICWSLWALMCLRPNGEVVVIGDDLDHPELAVVHSDWKHLVSALVLGSKRYPQLRELIPIRGPDAVDCSACDDIPRELKGTFRCLECSGLGWVPANIS